MNDDFMKALKKEPGEEFARKLREKLAEEEGLEAELDAPRGPARFLRPVLALAAAAAVIVAFSTSTALRASAQAFLDLFRVHNFVAVRVDPARIEQLRSNKIDMSSLIGDKVEELEKPGTPREFLGAAAAAKGAGMEVRVPTSIPGGFTSDTVFVEGAGAARVTVNGKRLRETLDLLGLSDVRVPGNVDGAKATIRTSPVVLIPYKRGNTHITLIQARSPEVSLPPGMDLKVLGEIGLRIMGLSEDEAHRFAASVDWRGTVLVPVPLDATMFREVSVHGQKGLLITTTPDPVGQRLRSRKAGEAIRPGEGHGPRTVLIWSEGDKVYGLTGNGSSEDMLIMANSLQ
jgi:hypothetical protein